MPSTSYWYARNSFETAATSSSVMACVRAMVSVTGDHAAEVDVLGDIDIHHGSLMDGHGCRPVGRAPDGLVGEVLERPGRVALIGRLHDDAAAADGCAAGAMFGSCVLERIAEEADQHGRPDSRAPML